jgi:hypothetical protein
MRRTALAFLLCSPVLFAACGDDADATAADGVVEVTLSDYSFGELPDDSLPAPGFRSRTTPRASCTNWSPAGRRTSSTA